MRFRLWSTHLLGAIAALLAYGTPHGEAVAKDDDRLSQRVMQLTRDTPWTAVAAIKIPFKTFHPQGMVKIGDDFYVSSVEVRRLPKRLPAGGGFDRDAGEGVGHLFKIGPDGALIADLRLGEGSIYHPGGIDFDGRSIWAPVSEYRPHSRAIVYRIDPSTMTAKEAFRFDDHLGAIVYDRARRQLRAMSWGSRQTYLWPPGFPSRPARAAKTATADQYIDYQDCHYVPVRRMLCSGLADYAAPQGGPRFELGGIDLIDLRSGLPLWQVPIELRSPSGRLMTQNPFFVEATPTGLRAYFMPDDDTSTLFVFDAAVKPKP